MAAIEAIDTVKWEHIVCTKLFFQPVLAVVHGVGLGLWWIRYGLALGYKKLQARWQEQPSRSRSEDGERTRFLRLYDEYWR